MLKININSLRPQTLLYKRGLSQGINHYAKDVLRRPTTEEDVLALARGATKKRNAFMSCLLHKYESANFYRKAAEKEDLSYVKNIYMLVKEPHREHFNLVERLGDSFENLERIFTASNNHKSYLDFAINVDKQILAKNKYARSEMIPEILESPYSKKYVRNFDKIKSYLILNDENPNAVKWLDNMMSRKIFSKKHFDKSLRKEIIKGIYPFEVSTKTLNPNTFYSIYSEPMNGMIEKICQYFYVSPEMLKNGNDKDIFNILKTTSSKNLNMRKFVIESFVGSYSQNSSTIKNEHISELNKLFNTLDNDRHKRNFLKNVRGCLPYSVTVKELNEIFAIVPSKKLESKRNLILSVLKNGSEEFKLHLLKEQMALLPDEGSFTKFFSGVKNIFKKKNKIEQSNSDILMSKMCVVQQSQPKPILAEPLKKVENKLQGKTFEIIEKPLITEDVKPSNVDKKQLVKDAVVGLVNKKLGAKTFEKQRDIYSANATKMRLSMLPEIFASITDTRKMDRTVGKLRSNSSNKDAINLFSKINGSNKKLVNYLLKKRNTDNSRMFEIKDIIAILDRAEAKIAKDKKANPEYRARDARRYYNHLYEAKIEQYGKVKRQTFNA